MPTVTTVKDELDRLGSTSTEADIHANLKRFIDSMSAEEALGFLDMVNNLLDDDELTPEEEEEVRQGREEIARGEFVTLEEYRERRGI